MRKDKVHIVLLTTWFPPRIGVPVGRMEAFVKYLDTSRFDIGVITLGDKKSKMEEFYGNVKIFRLENNKLLNVPEFIPKTTKIVHYLKVLWKLFVLNVSFDEYSDWRNKAGRLLQNIHNKKKIDIIISSFSPIAPVIAGYEFMKENQGVKWIVDMRDEMSRSPLINEHTKRKYEKIEKEINACANALITVSEPILNDFKQSMPDIRYMTEIRNGYDHELIFEDYQFNESFTMNYAGTFYGSNKPVIFLNALVDLTRENKLPTQWKMQFVGTNANFSVPAAIAGNVSFIDKQSYQNMLLLCRKADVNLLILNFHDQRKGVYSGKLFDYISVGKPVIALVNKEDLAAELIRNSSIGHIAHPENEEEIKMAILHATEDWKNRKIPTLNKGENEKLHRKYQVAKLQNLIEKLMDDREVNE